MNPIVTDWLTKPGGLATRLTELRNAAGVSGKELAEATGWQPSKVSRLENGHRIPTTEDVETWAGACRTPAGVVEELLALLAEAETVRVDFRRRMRRGQASVQADHNRLVRESTVVRSFETAVIPGLLQVPGYAERILAEMVELHDLHIDDVNAAVAVRMERQQMLYEPARMFEFLLAEPVLRWGLCPPDVMVGQLDRLLTLSALANVRLGILPLDRPMTTIPQNGFVLFDDVAIVETFIGETVHDEDESAAYARALDRLWADAVEGDAARRLILRAADLLRGVAGEFDDLT